LSKEELNAK